MATSSNSLMTQEQPWLANSAATDHVTSSLNHLSFPKPYTSQEHLTVGNGQNLPITHISNSLIPSTTSTLQLRNVLRVSSIASNLASIHKICHDNNFCYFDEHTCQSRPWPRGKPSTRVGVKMVFTLSILTRPLLFFLIKCAILPSPLLPLGLPSFLLPLGLYGTAGLVTQMLKLLDFCCKIMVCLVIVLLLSILVFIVFMAKCIDYHFLVLDL